MHTCVTQPQWVILLKLEQNGQHFADEIFKLFDEWKNFDNKSALVQVMAWQQTGDKPLPEPLLTRVTDAYMWH